MVIGVPRVWVPAIRRRAWARVAGGPTAGAVGVQRVGAVGPKAEDERRQHLARRPAAVWSRRVILRRSIA